MFGYNCDNLYWLGQPSGRGRTEILDLLSAESPSFLKYVCANYTTSSANRDDFLGDFLNTSPNTMADAENKWYSDLISSVGSSCSNCGCTFSNGDNEIKGFMWFTSSILLDHSIYRNSTPHQSRNVSTSFRYSKENNLIEIENCELYDQMSIFDYSGKVILNCSINQNAINIPTLSSGIYFVKLTDKLNIVFASKFIVQ